MTQLPVDELRAINDSIHEITRNVAPIRGRTVDNIEEDKSAS